MFPVPLTLRDMFWADPFFESAWGSDFDLLRQDMLRQHQLMWDRLNREFGGVEPRCASCLEHGNGASKEAIESGDGKSNGKASGDGHNKQVAARNVENWPWFMPPKSWLGPNLGLKDIDPSVSRVNQLMRIKEDDTKYEISLDTHEYRPDELKVNVKDNQLTIEGKHEEKSEDGKNFVSRHFFRHYTLPKGCEAQSITSNLSSDGVLMITAPKNPALANERNVPIEMDNK